MVEISLSGSGEGPGASKRPGLLDKCVGRRRAAEAGAETYRVLGAFVIAESANRFGKNSNKIVIAIARELVGFLWAALRDDRVHARAGTRTSPIKNARASATKAVSGCDQGLLAHRNPIHSSISAGKSSLRLGGCNSDVPVDSQLPPRITRLEVEER